MDQDKPHANTVEATSVTVADHSDGAVEATSAARPKQAGKRRGKGEAANRIGAVSDHGKAKPPMTMARATGAAAAKSEAEPEEVPATAAAPSKLDQLVTLLRTPGGATLPELQSATGWQVHSVRGAMAGALRKKGYSITSEKPGGGLRRYRIAEAS